MLKFAQGDFLKEVIFWALPNSYSVAAYGKLMRPPCKTESGFLHTAGTCKRQGSMFSEAFVAGKALSYKMVRTVCWSLHLHAMSTPCVSISLAGS